MIEFNTNRIYMRTLIAIQFVLLDEVEDNMFNNIVEKRGYELFYSCIHFENTYTWGTSARVSWKVVFTSDLECIRFCY